MKPLLPPLQAVRVFEAAARHSSFTRAAEELGMTQAAVSYQIKLLEERVGAPLFRRGPRGVKTTATGAQFSLSASEALEILRNAYLEARGLKDDTLEISLPATFAAHVLAPRIGKFQIAHPQFTVRVDVAHRIVDLMAGEASVAIRTGNGQWPDLDAHLLLKARYTPMLSPALLERYGPLNSPSDLLHLPLIDSTDPAWAAWFAQAGVAEFDSALDRQHQMGSQLLEAQAAVAGQGVCLLTPEYFRASISRGDLVQPFDLVIENSNSVWLVYPKRRHSTPSIRAFRSWLLAEMNELTKNDNTFG